MIEVKNVSFSYGRQKALENINLNFECGKIYAVIGPNGSGKTTLIKLLSRLVKPKEGDVFIDNSNYKKITRKDFAKKIALLPQARNTPDVTVFDLVCYARFPYLDISKRLGEDDYRIVNSALCATDTLKLAQKNVKKLSGGERQRVYIAMLIAQDTPYVLLDEPNSHLDVFFTFQILSHLKYMKDNGKCVIVVLHNLDTALKIADEIIVMDNANAVYKGSAQKIVSCNAIEKVFKVKCKSALIDNKTEYFFEQF